MPKYTQRVSWKAISFYLSALLSYLLASFSRRLSHHPDKMFCCCSVIQSCPTLGNTLKCSTPCFPVLHHLPELAQTHVHWLSDAIWPSCPLRPLLFNSQKYFWCSDYLPFVANFYITRFLPTPCPASSEQFSQGYLRCCLPSLKSPKFPLNKT